MHACQTQNQDKNFISLARIDFSIFDGTGILVLMTKNTLNIITCGRKIEECFVNLIRTPLYWGN